MKKKLFPLILICCSWLVSFGQIVVDPNYTVERLVKEVLVNSSCAETSNYKFFTGSEFNIDGIGYFNANGSNFPFQEGIVISTGNATDAEGPNVDLKTSGSFEWAGDRDLSDITRIPNLFNASYIEFDFVPKTNRISFNFLFASEEYSDAFQCVYSDVFAFILTDSSGRSTNLALVPGSNARVSATSIRPGVDGMCNPQNEAFFGGLNGPSSDISMSGETKSMVAQSEVIAGETYTIKLVIADNLDAELDSAVFLEGGSFSIDVSLGDSRTVKSGNPLCEGEVFNMDATASGAQHYRWYRNGTRLTHFDDRPTISVSNGGTYNVEVEFSPTCISGGEVEIEFITPPQLSQPPMDINICDFDDTGGELTDLTENTSLLLGNQNAEIYQVYYYLSREDAENFRNQIPEPSKHLLNQSVETIYARISSGESCYEITSFNIYLHQLNFSHSLQEEYVLCLDSNGTPIEPSPRLETNLSITDYSFTWYLNSIAQENLLAGEEQPFLIPSQKGIYYVVVRNRLYDCEIPISTTVITSEPPAVFEINMLSELFSNNHEVAINVEGESTYLFSMDNLIFGDNPVFSNLAPGEHTAYVQDSNECSIVSKKFLIVDYPRFFTPNGDGYNDTWSIVGLFEIENPEITIFDRYGVILYRFDNDIGWDGTVRGNKAPSTDYWFKLSYDTEDGIRKEYKSHFTLKR
ncbi:T9SS type B sorting domain-containing protein [Flagellimonas onchidii]|uniref:T9SS type B sorting domain-containing protein n=1 Tax=Flagellimonas onchidii TaxID=2562684 RepID=UPI0010A5EA6C|nr:choice-of-anchor L domain-containing protein [Allomuricauda onchidii]